MSQRYPAQEADLAYGDLPTNEYDASELDYETLPGEDGDRGIIGDTYRKFRGKPPLKPGESGGLGHFVFGKLHEAVEDIGSELGKHFEGKNRPAQSSSVGGKPGHEEQLANPQIRFGSFAEPKYRNDAKWYVDGCGYMWAVSEALLRARESIWILDCEFAKSPYLHDLMRCRVAES